MMNTQTTIIVILVIIVIIGIIAAVSLSGPTSTTISNSTTTQSTSTQYFTSTSTATTTGTTTGTTGTTSGANRSTALTVVTYDGSRFSPSPVTINAGQSVTFVNNSPGRLWVASNPHPTHTDLPGFDELQYINRGQSWTYTFNRPGTWGYHNHSNPAVGGTVVVQ